jgi:hypothetical protein
MSGMTDDRRNEQTTEKRFRLSDRIVSVLLPLAVIAFGVALSVGPGRLQAFVDLCRSALPQ